MGFEAVVSGENKTIVLKNNSTGTFTEIFCFGALLNKFCVYKNRNEINIIDGFTNINEAEQTINSNFKSVKLSPFVCRMKNGEYIFEGEKHKVTGFYLGDHAIHGLLYYVIFHIKSTTADETSASVVLDYQYKKDNGGFPFSYDAEITYTLEKENTLSLCTKITNTGKSNMPLSDGWHPYFKLDETISDLELQMNTTQLVEFDDGLLPTGKTLPYTKFNSPEPINDTFLDNCFVLTGNDRPACILINRESGIELKILPGESYPYLQVFTPDHRKSIAIENLSSLPDAFNNGSGLIITKPGESYTFKTTYQVNILTN